MLNVPFKSKPSLSSGGTGDKKKKINEVPVK